jgi:hypothetical protein
LSSGEIGLADKVAENGRGKRLSAGQQVRVVNIPANAGAGLVLFEDLHEFPSSEALATHFSRATRSPYVTAASAFVGRIAGILIRGLKPKPNGGRKHENMSLAEEKGLLARFAKRAGAGEMLNIHDLKAAYEKAIGHSTSDSTVYNLLHRHGWRKLMPRPFHPKRDLAAQNAFKKAAFLTL